MLKPVVSEVRYMHWATPVHSSQLAFTRSRQLGGEEVVVSFGGLLVVASGVDNKLLELLISAGSGELLLDGSCSLGSPDTEASALMDGID